MWFYNTNIQQAAGSFVGCFFRKMTQINFMIDKIMRTDASKTTLSYCAGIIYSVILPSTILKLPTQSKT